MTDYARVDLQDDWPDSLREVFPPGATAYTVLRHVSASGMTRRISVVGMTPDGPWDVSPRVAALLDRRWDRDSGGIKVEGTGMDMGFEVVYSMSRRLYPEGFECIGDGRELCATCGGSGKRATARTANGRELERHERSGTPCDACGGDGWTGRYVGLRCPSNDHSNGDRDYSPHHHGSGGYAVSHRWL
jgi:hypothetical protein